MIKTTRAQRERLLEIYKRDTNVQQMETYKQFRKRVEPGLGCIMILWCGMWIGIEKDGYAHT